MTIASTCVHTWAQECDSTDILWAFVLVLELGTSEPWVNCPYATTTLPIHRAITSRFLSNYCSPDGPSIFWVNDSKSNMAETRYPCSGPSSSKWGRRKSRAILQGVLRKLSAHTRGLHFTKEPYKDAHGSHFWALLRRDVSLKKKVSLGYPLSVFNKTLPILRKALCNLSLILF